MRRPGRRSRCAWWLLSRLAGLIHWIHKEGMDELYDLERDPYELHNVIRDRRYAAARKRLTNELRKLVTDAIGL